jgi:hypothetical protein
MFFDDDMELQEQASRFKFDDPIDDDELYASSPNPSIQVSDPVAEYISNCLNRTLTDENVEGCIKTDTSFTGLSKHGMNSYIQDLHNREKVGRYKQDFYLPFPTSRRTSEHDLIKDFSAGPEQYWRIASCFQSSRDEIPISELEEMGFKFPNHESTRQDKGSYKLGSQVGLFEEYSDHLCRDDDVSADVQYLFETTRLDSPLLDHEINSIDCYKQVIMDIAASRLCNYTLFLRRLAENIMHSSRKVGKKMCQIRQLGDSRIILLQSHSSLSSVESGPLCSFIIKMSKYDYELYSKLTKLRIMFQNSRDEVYVFVKWRSFDLIDTSIMLKSNYHLLVYPLMFTDSLDIDSNLKLRSLLKLMTGMIQCRNSEVFSVLSSFRYILPGVLNKFHNISELICDKFPKIISSPFSDFIVSGILDWLNIFEETVIIKDRSTKTGNVRVLDEYDVEFHCLLPYVGFNADNFDQYLSMTYLVSMTVGKTKQSRHVQLNLVKTLTEWERKAKDYSNGVGDTSFDYSQDFLDKSCDYLLDCVEVGDGGTDELITKFLRAKGTFSPKDQSYKRLFDRTLAEIDHPIHDCTLASTLESFPPKAVMRMAVRDDHAGEREIFVTDLQSMCALNIIEGVAHSICEQLSSEHITLGGDRKILVMQTEAQMSLSLEEKGWENYLGSEDASKWSTGDNPNILLSIWNKINKNVPDKTRIIVNSYLESMKERDIHYQKNYSDYLSKESEPNKLRLTMGWPQGFFNKLSSLKHYLCYCLALAMFKRVYDKEGIIKVKFAVHSDDSRHRLSFDTEDQTKEQISDSYSKFIQCLYWAKEKFLIRPNKRKSFYGGVVSEYLSNFQFHGSLFIPKSKFVLGIFGDLTGNGYPSDMYSVMERIRTTLRMNIGSSLGCFMMRYANNYVLRLYSMLPGMRGHDKYRNTKTNLIEMGGIFSCHPIYLLFLGCKAHDILNYFENKSNVSKLIGISQFFEDVSETSPSELYNHFLPIPSSSMPNKGLIRHIRKKYRYVNLLPEERWMPLYLSELDLDNAAKVARYLLFSPSLAKSYSTAPEGLMYARIQQTWDKASYQYQDKNVTFWEFVKIIEDSKEVDNNIYEDLVKSSPTLLSILNLEKMLEITVSNVCRTHVSSSQVNMINVLSPGGNSYRYLKYALSNLLNLDINVPERVDQKRLKFETDMLEKDVSRIPGIKESDYKLEVNKIYKFLNVRNAKPSYLHLNKFIPDPSKLDMYELTSTVLKQYSPSITGKVSLGKISSVSVGERTFRPENISYRINREDEIHTCAKVLSLAKQHLSKSDYIQYKESLSIGGKSVHILLDSHPYRSNIVSYYLDYLFISNEYQRKLDTGCTVKTYMYDDENMVVRSGKNCMFVDYNKIVLHDKIHIDKSFEEMLAIAYFRKYQLWLVERNDWSDIEMPSELVLVCPHLYYEYEKKFSSKPALAVVDGRICYKSGFHNKYLSNISVECMSENLLNFEGEEIPSTKSFSANLTFEMMKIKSYSNEEELELGYGLSWEGLNTYLVGEQAKFEIGVLGDNFPLLGSNSRTLFGNRYFRNDDLLLLKTGITVPDVSRHKRAMPLLNISDLKKSDFNDIKKVCKILLGQYGYKESPIKKSLFFSDNIEPEKNIFDFFGRSSHHSSQMKNILSCQAYVILCQNLMPIRCRIEHMQTLSALYYSIRKEFKPGLDSLKPSKVNLVKLVMHTSALIGILQETNEPIEGNLTGEDFIQFIKYSAYSNCVSGVWHSMFSSYMSSDEADIDDLE